MQGFRRHSPAGQQLVSESCKHMKGGRDTALPHWAAGLGSPGWKDVSGSCSARDMSPYIQRASSPRQKMERKVKMSIHTGEQNTETTSQTEPSRNRD